MRDTKNVVGHVGSARSTSGVCPLVRERPSLDNLQGRSNSSDHVHTNRCHRRVPHRREVGRESAAREVLLGRRVEGRRSEIGLDVVLGEIPPVLDDGSAVRLGLAFCRVESARAGIPEIDETTSGTTGQLMTGDAANGLLAPIGTDIAKELRTLSEEAAEQHRYPVEGISLGGKDLGLTQSIRVEAGVEQGFHDVAVQLAISPLTLALEAGGDGVVTTGLFLESHVGQTQIAVHEVSGNQHHLDRILQLFTLVSIAVLLVSRISVLTDAETHAIAHFHSTWS